MHEDAVQFERLLDGFLADELSREDQRAFDSMLDAQPALRREIELQRAINTSLRERWAAPTDLAMGAKLNGALHVGANDQPRDVNAPKRRPMEIWLRRLTIAAVIMLGAYGAWMTWQYVRPVKAGYQQMAWRPPNDVFHDTVGAGFKPVWVCKDDEQFIRSVRSALGQRLAVHNDDPSVRVLGLAYANTISPGTVLILAKVNDQPAMVFADQLKNDRTLPDPTAGTDMHWYRGEIGDLVVYELSPGAEASLLPRLYIPAKLADDSCEPEAYDTTEVTQITELSKHE